MEKTALIFRYRTASPSTFTQHLSKFILLLAAIQMLYISPVSGTGSSVSTSSCNVNCTGKAEEPLCASDGRTYINRCELKRARCISRDTNLRFVHHGECTTPAPALEILKNGETCSQHRIRIFDHLTRRSPNYEAWGRMCNRTTLLSKAEAGTLTITDLLGCYRPACKRENGEYLETQCHWLSRENHLCWCSGPTGFEINGTLAKKQSMPTDFCKRSSCEYQGQTFKDGTLFQPPQHACGICECLDGNVTCFEDFVPDINDQLNATQIEALKYLLLQLFLFEYTRQGSVLVDIRFIYQHITSITDEVRQEIVLFKFKDYDSNGDGIIKLDNTEEVSFHADLYQFTWCKRFLSHISEVIDTDQSASITLGEWKSFFGVEDAQASSSVRNSSTQTKRSASPRFESRLEKRSLQNRKKFYYVTL